MDNQPSPLPYEGKIPAVAWRTERWLFQVKRSDGTLYNWWCNHIDLHEAIRLWNKHVLDYAR